VRSAEQHHPAPRRRPHLDRPDHDHLGARLRPVMFTKTPLMFYSLRFALGLAEAGFFPGIILYLTYWYPSDRRARMISLFMTAIPISGIIGGPLSGWIMQSMEGVNGWRGWQWLFLVEAMPAI